MECIANKNIEGLKEIKEEIGREKWLNLWGGKSVPLEARIEDNAFVEFK